MITGQKQASRVTYQNEKLGKLLRYSLSGFAEPIKGLHYAEYPHNDTSQPRVPDHLQDVVTISSQASIGNVNSYQGLNSDYTRKFFKEYDQFVTDAKETRRWTNFCREMERPYGITHEPLMTRSISRNLDTRMFHTSLVTSANAAVAAANSIFTPELKPSCA